MDIAASTEQGSVPVNRRRVWMVAIAALVVVLVVLAGTKAMQIGAMIKAGKSFTIPPEAVTSAKVEPVEWQASRPAVATLVAVRGVTLASEVAGTVREIGFDSGSFVRKGAMLVKLDISTEEAQLAAARADANLARANRSAPAACGRRSRTRPPTWTPPRRAKSRPRPTSPTLQATIAKKTIRAPFDGRISIRQVELGQVLAPGTPIASLQSDQPHLRGVLAAAAGARRSRRREQARLRTDVFPQSSWDGLVTTINSEVDVSTRNVRVRATFPNLDGRLRARHVRERGGALSDKRHVLVIPATSVVYAPYGDSVFSIEEKAEGGKTSLVAHQKFVRLGERRGDLVAVESGLAAGETIVSSGAFKLRNGASVMVRDDLAPEAAAAPVPTDK